MTLEELERENKILRFRCETAIRFCEGGFSQQAVKVLDGRLDHDGNLEDWLDWRYLARRLAEAVLDGESAETATRLAGEILTKSAP